MLAFVIDGDGLLLPPLIPALSFITFNRDTIYKLLGKSFNDRSFNSCFNPHVEHVIKAVFYWKNQEENEFKFLNSLLF
jgi:hypothetical protein